MKKLIEITYITLSILFLTITITPAQEKMDSQKMENNTTKSCCSVKENNDCCMKENKSSDNQSLDVKTIDKNEDGKVFQCPMCANQISDKEGKCSKCEMNLKEVSIEKAQTSLDAMSDKLMDHSDMDNSDMINHDMEHKKQGKQ